MPRGVRLNNYVKCRNYYEIILTNKNRDEIGRAKIDKEDFHKVAKCRWGVNGTTRTTQGWIRGKITTMHQLILSKKDGYVIDHINHDSLDNRKKNLRYATKSQNGMNQKGVLGVTYLKERKDTPGFKKRWFMQIQKLQDGKKIRLYSSHYTREDAIKARKEAEKELFGEYMYKEY